MKNLNASIQKAIEDYRFLLERGYPDKTSLKMVVVRYGLSGNERSMIFRGISTTERATYRREKLFRGAIRGKALHIDLLNVLLTINSYLSGNLVFISTDGFLRDAGENRGMLPLIHFERSVALINSYLRSEDTGTVHFYLDRKPDISGKVSKNEEILVEGLPPGSRLHIEETSDHILEKVETGIIGTSDSIIIERCEVPVVDLPSRILNKNFTPDFFDITDLT